MNCLDENTLVAFGDGSLSGVELSSAAAHLQTCESCRAILAGVYETSGRLRTSQARLASAAEFLPHEALPKLAPGTVVGRYVIESELGEGGMGVVYSAKDTQLGRRVALKFLRVHQPTERLVKEAQTLARIEHPHVVTVFDVATHDGAVFIAMELIEGTTLARWLTTKPKQAEIVDAFLAAGRGLAAAHAVGVVHRDFKPANVLRHHDGRVKVTDFGLAFAPGLGDAAHDAGSSVSTNSGSRPGTPLFMAPEQLTGSAVDTRADQFSFCVALYEALHGVRPFAGQSIAALLGEIERSEFQLGSATPSPGVERVLRRGLSNRPVDRFPDMASLLAALDGTRRSRTPLIVGAAVGALVLGIAIVGSTRETRGCSPSAERLTGIWDDSVRERIDGAFTSELSAWAPDLGTRLKRSLDDYAASWVTARNEACDATWVRKEQSEHALDLRMRCLERRRTELAAVSRFLTTLDKTGLDKATSVVRGLSGIESCADASRLEISFGAPLTPAAKAAGDAVRERISTAKVLHDSGRFSESLTTLEPLTTTLASLEDLSSQAEGWLWLGTVELKLGHIERAKELLRRALTTGSINHDDDVMLRALCQLVELAAVREHDAAATEEHRRLLELTRARRAPDVELQAIIENQLGLAAFEEKKLDVALEHFRAARREYEKMNGPASTNIVRTINNIGVILSEQAKPAEARVELQAARELLATEHGEFHPDVARADVNLGVVCNDLGDFDCAEEHFLRAETAQRRSLGEAHPDLAATHNNWGDARLGMKDPLGALEHFQRALTIREGVLGKTSLRLIGDLNGIVTAARESKRVDIELEALQRIVTVWTADGAHPAQLGHAELAIARAEWTTNLKHARSTLADAERHLAEAKDDAGLADVKALRASTH